MMAKELYNPHAEETGGVDLQCPAVYQALENWTLFERKRPRAIGIELNMEENILYQLQT